jgi:molybdate transport system substrate-binding protein
VKRLLLFLALACACKPAAPLTVFAAASLREAFTAIAAGSDATFNFAGSQELRTQIEHDAPADVFASADIEHMAALEKAGRVGPPALFARNEPVLVVARDKSAAIKSFADLPAAEKIVLGAAGVPIGRYSAQILDKAGADFRARVEAHVVSREANVRQVLAKVSLGEADAAIVYRTDAAAAAGKVTVVTIPAETNVIAAYAIAVVRSSKHPDAASAFVDRVLSADGQAALQKAGFLPAKP